MNIRADGLTVRFGAATILDGVGLALSSGEIVGLIGPNGAGKTTLLRVLADLLRASAGAVRYDGRSRARNGTRDACATAVFSGARRRRLLAVAGRSYRRARTPAASPLVGRHERRGPRGGRARDEGGRCRASQAPHGSDALGGPSACAFFLRALLRSRPKCCSPTNPSLRSIHCISFASCNSCDPPRRRARASSSSTT